MIRPTLCGTCARFIGGTQDRAEGTCIAFPDGIPGPFIRGEVLHLKPYKNRGKDDRGLLYLSWEDMPRNIEQAEAAVNEVRPASTPADHYIQIAGEIIDDTQP